MVDLQKVTIDKISTTLNNIGDLVVKVNLSYILPEADRKVLADLTACQKTTVNVKIDPEQLSLEFSDDEKQAAGAKK